MMNRWLHIFRFHWSHRLPMNNIAAIIIQYGAQVIPAPAQDFSFCKICFFFATSHEQTLSSYQTRFLHECVPVDGPFAWDPINAGLRDELSLVTSLQDSSLGDNSLNSKATDRTRFFSSCGMLFHWRLFPGLLFSSPNIPFSVYDLYHL